MKKVFLDKDGKLNRKTVTSLVLLLIVLVQQLCAIFNLKFTGDVGQIMDLVNTLLTIGGILGLVDGVTVDTETVKSIDKTANEALKLASQHQGKGGKHD
ncbi:hypothetical protein AYP76_07535 [Ligilactobacillus agilis]|uniref:Uncharacterized protein n=1 Tax=Ligilactobacillus agilis TaxID=1601 RepID=A0A231QUB1_9LACO|nr:hypothetical protein [Ligilactobacillus agilis]ASR40327.1 hypothetical protein BEN83_01835 [Ligilactobacillus agilis]ASR40614.1 hypothetical protein BEN83_03520 [Ligilactobacillus agilis]OXC07224.1 hypothetical protein AYP74_08495 [Ligilactobacillus agilis]OXC07588.1 hypothetical protein AYP76_07535 [Ligilactobacillus agilis]OXC11033.1 hypothetical protein AYP75_05040 [Ligilactobacillus agilis]